eukprot:COSAG02_NODE_52711_length_306_cov_0.743961_1_plen_66_part_10
MELSAAEAKLLGLLEEGAKRPVGRHTRYRLGKLLRDYAPGAARFADRWRWYRARVDRRGEQDEKER